MVNLGVFIWLMTSSSTPSFRINDNAKWRSSIYKKQEINDNAEWTFSVYREQA